MQGDAGYVLYGNLEERETAGLAAILVAKQRPVQLVEESASLAMVLESRSGSERGPYLRTPEGFLLAGARSLRDWLERAHPEPALLPRGPVRRICARLVEDWLTLWLPDWPRRVWRPLEVLGAHLERSPFLLGAAPMRPDHLLAAWLETEVLVDPAARAHLEHVAPALVGFGDRSIEASRRRAITAIAEGHAPADAIGAVAANLPPAMAASRGRGDVGEGSDVLPISLLGVLEEIGRDHLTFLALNQRALKDGESEVVIDLGLGPRPFPTRPEAEVARVALGRELAAMPPTERRRVERVLDPLGLWDVLRLPPLETDAFDPADPRAL